MTERTDGDSWDLSSSVGATATMVAASRALASRSDRPLINDPFAEPLVRAVGMPYFNRLLDGENPSGDPEYDPQQSADHMAVRTKYYDEFFLDAGRHGIRQAVILAAGLDTRAYRLPWPAGTAVYEIDLPAVLDFKGAVLADLGASPTATHRTVGIDLRDDWPAALRDAGLDAAAPTVWSAEGLLYYLPPEAQDMLFDHITALSAPGSRLAADFIPDMSVFGSRIAAAGERWDRMEIKVNDLVYQDIRRHAAEHLTEHGWRVSTRTITELHDENGLQFPDREVFAAFADTTYLNAEQPD
jgi:methyltransferase (TIGR00027 family)